MSTRMLVVPLLLTVPLAVSSCGTDARGADVLPGHSRPVFVHDWPHPREMELEDPDFKPADPASALLVTPSGTRAWILEDAADPVATIVAAIPLGRQFEASDEIGATDVVARRLSRRLSERLDAIAADVRLEQDPDLTRVSIEVLAEDWKTALSALVRTLRDAGPEASATGSSVTGPLPSGGGATRPVAELARLVGSYPLAQPDPDIRVRPEAVRSLAERSLQPGSIALGIGGGVPAAEARTALFELTAGWSSQGVTAASAHPPALADTRIPADPLHTIDVPGFMSWIAIGHAMAPIEPGDEAAVAVMAEIINIRLNIETREIRGLTNRALLVLPAATDGAGLLHVRTSGRSESVAPLIRYSVEALSKMRTAEAAPTQEELEQAKGGLVPGRWQESLDGARRTAMTWAIETVRRGSLDHLLDWPDAVRAVTAADVTAAAHEYIDPGALTVVVVGQIDEVRAARHPRWPLALDEVPALLRPASRP